MLVLDTSPFPSLDEVAKQQVVLRNRDSMANFDQPLTEYLISECDNLKIRYRFKDHYVELLNLERDRPLSIGRTELGRVIASTDGLIRGTTLQFPTSSYHTATETAEISSIEAMLKLLRRICDID